MYFIDKICQGKERCSFCGMSNEVGEGLLMGPSGVAICTTCAKNVLDMFAHKQTQYIEPARKMPNL